MFVRNSAAQASFLQQNHLNSAHDICSGTAFMCKIVMLLL